ncbi:MAG TPA: heme o synthase [Micropepsaceae bacterium]|nr:heme o synthase [Micropepsaceae bacterium]
MNSGTLSAIISGAATTAPAHAPSLATASDFFALLKPRVMSLVVFTGIAGIMLAPTAMHPVAALTALFCIAAGAGASGALNMWFDADIDAIMARTQSRPIPRGRITPSEALGFGVALSLASIATMGVLVNWLAAGLLAFTIAFYVFVYTMGLKRRTPQNIVIGGLAGAMPPAIGWAAATGSLAVEPLVLVALIFMWTPPHFWALALYRADDYARAGVPMLPVVAGERATKNQIILYTLVFLAVSALPVLAGFAGLIYAATALAFGAVFLGLVLQLCVMTAATRALASRRAMRVFGFSILHLFALFASLIAEAAFGVSALMGSLFA